MYFKALFLSFTLVLKNCMIIIWSNMMKLSFWSSNLTDYDVHKHTSVQLEISFSLREILYSRLFKQCLVVFYKNKQFSLKILKRLGAVSNM